MMGGGARPRGRRSLPFFLRRQRLVEGMLPPSEPSRDAWLAASFFTLGNPARLALLRQLRTPRAMGEIELRDGEDGRPLSRQSVREHLDRLLEAGLAVAMEARERDARSPLDYMVDHQGLFALSEEIRALARLRPALEPPRETVDMEAGARRLPPGPCLVVAKGLEEGVAFRLEGSGVHEWILGRKRGIAIPLDFDPYISAENSRITWRDGRHALEDLPDSRNGTSLNFERLPKGRAAPLSHGDLVGVGRTLLLYRAT